MISSNKLALLRKPLRSALLLIAAATISTVPALAQTVPTLPPADLTSGQFTTGCGNATAAPIFNAALMNSGLYGENNLIVVSDPDIVLINNQWWMIFATGPTGLRAIQPFAAYLPPGASLSTTTTYPADPNGWHLVGAQANGQGQSYPVYGIPGTNGWDQLAAETPSVDVGPDGSVSIYYSGHNAGQTPFQIGLMTNFNAATGTATGDPNPVMTATLPWEYSANLPALLEQSVRWIPALNKFIMYYTAGAWWASPAPDNDIAYAESTDGINWVNRAHLGFPVAYYNQDFLYNEQHHRFEMVISHDRTGAGGGNPRDIVWREAATPATSQANWVNEQTLLLYSGTGFISSGILSPSMKYGNLPGEENRLYVFFHSYDTAGNMYIGRFYCDATASSTPTFSLSQSNPAVAVVQGNTATMTFGVNDQAGFTGAVNFSVSGAPTGVTAALTQTSSTTGTSVNISVSPTAAIGRYPIVVTGTSGNITQTSTFTLTVNGPPNFTLSPSTTNLSLAPGAGNTMSINVNPVNAFNGTVNLSASGFPSTVNNSFLQTSTTTGSTFVIYVQPATAPGTYPITVTGVSGSLTTTTNFTLTVTGPPTFSLTATAASVTPGSSTTVNVGVTPQNGFNSAVSFSATGFPTGVTGTFAPTSSAAGTTLSLAASSTAVPGTYPITVTGTSGTITQTTAFTLTVAGQQGFSLTSSATTLSLVQGTGTTVNIGVTPQNGFTGAVSFSASGFPATVNNSFLQTSSTTGTTLVIYVQSATAAGQYPISVTGTSGTLTQTTNFTLTVTAAPTFSLTAAAASVTQGSSTTVNVSVTPQNGFSGAVSFSASGFPAGVTGTFQASTLSVAASSTAAAGQYTITVTGTSGALTKNTTFTLTVVATQQPQTITFNAIPAQKVGTTLTVNATASSNLPVTFSVIPNGNCSVSGNTVTFLNVGNCGIVANQAGNSSYAAAPAVGQIVVVNNAPSPQTITFGAIPAQTVGAKLTVSATATSGLPVTFSVIPNGNCSISGNTVTFLNTGNCGIVANQAGNSSYAAAPSVGQVVVVNSAPSAQTITFNPITAVQKVGTTLTVSATASSGLPVTFTVVANGNCSISGNVVKFLNAGACGVIANQAGNASYLAAPAVGQVISVSN